MIWLAAGIAALWIGGSGHSGLLIAAGLASAAWAPLSLRLHPYGPCWACGGKGTNWGSDKKRHGKCWLCKGSRERFRAGARLVHRGRKP